MSIIWSEEPIPFFHSSLPPLEGWEGITDPVERYFLAAVFALPQPPAEPNTLFYERQKLVSIKNRYQRLLYKAWMFDTENAGRKWSKRTGRAVSDGMRISIIKRHLRSMPR